MGQKSIEATEDTIGQKTKTHRHTVSMCLRFLAMGGGMEWGGRLLHKIRANQKQNIIPLGQKHFYFKGHFGTRSMCNRTHD